MATVVVTLKIMPDSPETDVDGLIHSASEEINNFGGKVGKASSEPVAFGLNAAVVFFIIPEEKGSTEELEKKISEIAGVSSVQVTDVRRTIG